MRMRVVVDITEPLCRGRKITWDQKKKGWVLFQYECLPNICYWCGHLLHDDKDCVLWLRSKGSLMSEDQQFGPWTPQFNPARKTVVEVQGFEVGGSQTTSTKGNAGTSNRSPIFELVIPTTTRSPQITLMTTFMEAEGSGVAAGESDQADGDTEHIINLAFESIVRGINDAINT